MANNPTSFHVDVCRKQGRGKSWMIPSYLKQLMQQTKDLHPIAPHFMGPMLLPVNLSVSLKEKAILNDPSLSESPS